MAEFVLTAVEMPPKEWTGDHGTFHIYTVQFKGDQGEGTAQIKQKASSPAPTEGQTLDAEIVHKREGLPPELKRIYQNRNGGGAPRQRDPVETKRIIHQHAQKVAIEYVKAKAILKQIEGFTAEDVFSLAKAFREDVERVS